MRISSFVFSLVVGLGLGAAWLGGSGQGVRAAQRGVLHVCASGCAYQSIQAAVDAAAPGDVVKIAQGVYTGVAARSGITQVLYVDKPLSIQGGFTTTNWNQPDPLAYPTTIDAQNLGRGVVISGAISVTLRGLRITGGNASNLGGGQTSNIDLGGGVYVYTATVSIENCRLLSNTASTTRSGRGGGIGLFSARARLLNNEIRGNLGSSASQGDGGGVGLWNTGTVWMEGNTIRDNTGSDLGTGTPTGGSGYGGGVYAYQSGRVTLTGNAILSNTASVGYIGSGGGIYLGNTPAAIRNNTLQGNTASLEYHGYGGGLYLWNLSSTVITATIEGNTFMGNTASKNSAPTRNGQGGGAYLTKISNGRVFGNLFRDNVASTSGAGYGGGLFLSGTSQSEMRIEANYLLQNRATLAPSAKGLGGGFYASGTPLWFANNIVAGNQANTAGGGLCLESAEAPTRYVNNTVADNLGPSAVYVSEPPVQTGGLSPRAVYTPAFTNTLLAGNAGFAVEVALSTTASFQATLWYGNGGLITGTGQARTGGVNVYAPPGFAAETDYHIPAGSPAQDAGLPAALTSDVDGEPRPYGRKYDIGADEVQASALYLPLMMR